MGYQPPPGGRGQHPRPPVPRPGPPHQPPTPVTEPGEPPGQVRWAARSMIASGLLGVAYIGLVRSYGSYHLAVLHQVARSYERDFGMDAGTFIDLVIGLSVGSAAVFIALWFWWAIMVRLGRNWARVLATVFAALYLAYGLQSYLLHPFTSMLGTAGRAANYAAVMDIAVYLAMVLGLVLAWSRPATEWFRAGKRWRRQQRQLRGVSDGLCTKIN